MTIITNTVYVAHRGNNAATVFPYNFRLTEPAMVRVSLRDYTTKNVLKVLLPAEYSITGVTPANQEGGNVTYPLTGAPLGSSTELLIERVVNYQQDLVLLNEGGFYPEAVEYQLDKIVMQTQQLANLVARSVVSSQGVEPPKLGILNPGFLLQYDENNNIVSSNTPKNEKDLRIAGDEALSALIGLVGSGNAPLFDTITAVQLANINPLVKAIRIAGYYSAGDGGDALYVRVSSEPTHGGKVQSLNGAWWELTGNRVTPEMFGVLGSGLVDATPGLQAAVDYLEYRNGGILDVPAKIYFLMGTWRIPSNVKVFSAPNTIYRRAANTDCMLISKSAGVIGGYNAVSNITIIGGVFDCNKDNYPTPASSLAFGHCKDVSVDSIAVLNNSGRYHAIEINAQLRFKVTNSVFYVGGNDEVAGECLQIDGAYNSGVFPWYGPYDDTPCEDVVIAYNSFDEWATAIGTHSLPNGTTRHTKIDIRKNVMKVSRRGIVMQGWAGVKIIDNHISGIGPADGTSQMAIQGVAGKMVGHTASDITISGNTILNFTRLDDGSGNAGRGISMMGWQSASDAPIPTLQNVVITDNYLSGLGSHGIAIEAASNVFVANNTVIGLKGHAVYMYGTGRYTIQGNYLNSPTGKQAINLVAAHGRNPSEGVVTGNRAYPEIYSNAPGTIVTNNITNLLNYGGLSTGIKGPNLVNGVVVP